MDYNTNLTHEGLYKCEIALQRMQKDNNTQMDDMVMMEE